MSSPCEVKDGYLILKIKVTPKASQNAVGHLYQDSEGSWRLKIMVTTVPEAGKATASVVKLLSKYLKIPQKAIEVVSGATHPHKTLRISVGGDEAMLALTTRITALRP